MNSFLRSVAGGLILFLLMLSTARAEETYELDIADQELSSALKTFAEQSGLQVVYFADLAAGEQANGVRGTYSAGQALSELLDDTDLIYSKVDDRTYSISRAAAAEDAGGDSDSGNGRPAGATPRPVIIAQSQRVAQQNQESQADERESEREKRPIEEIVVTGSHIRGIEPVGAVSMVFTQDELSTSGYSTLAEVFESLPQNLDAITPDGALATGASRIASANSPRASSVSLRGLGPGATLVLLNGKRRPGAISGLAFDVSAIPLSMVDRVEVITGGRSSIYGSDAVAGVVNIVTRKESDGAETQLYYGGSSAGRKRFSFSQDFGASFQRGGFILGYVYRKDDPLDGTDTGLLRAPSTLGITPLPNLYELLPASEQHVGLVSGHYELSDSAEVYADAHFSSESSEIKSAFNFNGLIESGSVSSTQSDQYSVASGIRMGVGETWQLDLSAIYGVVDTTRDGAVLILPAGSITDLDVPPDSRDHDKAKIASFSATANGPLFALGSSAVSGAIGIEFRNQSFEAVDIDDLLTGVIKPVQDSDRYIASVFGELHLPLITRNEERLEVSLAGRYDSYSDFGGTFNPQLGLEWEPFGGLTLSGSYAEAFRAPGLILLALDTTGSVQIVDDPLASDGTAALFVVQGGNPDLQPEEANTWTVGINWEPSDRTEISLSYFSIEYEKRIDEPAPSPLLPSVLENANLYGNLINRSPTPEQLDAVLDRADNFFNRTATPFNPETEDPFATFSDIVLFDDRRNNVASESIDGLDIQAAAVLETLRGDWLFGLNGTYYFDFTRSVTVASPRISQLNRPGRPIDLRLRGHIGWSSSAWSVNTYVNYTDNYVDTIAAIPTRIDSWTTVDLTLRFDASTVTDSGFLNGLSTTLGINNVFDKDPPTFLSNIFALGYDSANANPLGRFVSLRLSKQW